MPMRFDMNYFAAVYGDYERQNPAAKLRHYLDILVRHGAQGSLLDIGCSFGRFVEIAKNRFNCTGMDVDPDVVAEATRRVPGVKFLEGCLPDIPCAGMDVITLLDVIEHVPEPSEVLKSVYDALKPGVIALLVIPVYDGPFGWLVEALDHDPTHIHKCSRKFWLDLVSSRFKLLEWHGVFRKLFFSRIYLNIPTQCLRRIAPAIILVLRKKP